MTDKKTFGAFIKSKRTEKNFSQKELARQLFVTEGAISKWERGVSYPDITLIAEICRVLDVSEHELITASTDEDTQKMKQEAKNFRVIRSTWFWVPTISYVIALLVCFICNLAVNHTLSWFFIVLAALICAYSFVPTFSMFFKRKKLLGFTVTSFCSIGLLLLTCAIYTNGLFWWLTACIGVLMGYVLVFLPILLSKSRITRYKFVISFTATAVLTVLLLLNIYSWQPFRVGAAMAVTGYAYLPVILCAVIALFRVDGFLKAGICTVLCTVAYYFTGYVTNYLFGLAENYYAVNFNDWVHCLQGNIQFIFITSFLFISAVLAGIGILRICKKK